MVQTPTFYDNAIPNLNTWVTVQEIKSCIRRNQVNFLVYRQDSKKIGSVGRQNKNNVIWFLGSVFFKKIIFCIGNTEEKPAGYDLL